MGCYQCLAVLAAILFVPIFLTGKILPALIFRQRASSPGSVHDSSIGTYSNIYNMMQWKVDTPEQRSYNRLFTRSCVIIERCFGPPKQRFLKLHNQIRVNVRKVLSLGMSCFIVHNVGPRYARRWWTRGNWGSQYNWLWRCPDTSPSSQLIRDAISRNIHGFRE